MRTLRKGTARAALLTASFVVLGAGVAQADVAGGVTDLLGGSPVKVNLPSGAPSASDVPVVGDVQKNVQKNLPNDQAASDLKNKVQESLPSSPDLPSGGPELPADAPDLPTAPERLNDGGSSSMGADNNVRVPGLDLEIDCTNFALASDARADCPGGDNGSNLGFKTESHTFSTGPGLDTGGDGDDFASHNTVDLGKEVHGGAHCDNIVLLADATATCAKSFSGGDGDVRTMRMASDPRGGGNGGGGPFSGNEFIFGDTSADIDCTNLVIAGNASANCGGGAIPGDSDDGGTSANVECINIGVLSNTDSDCDEEQPPGAEPPGNGGGGEVPPPDNGGPAPRPGPDTAGPGQAGGQLPFTGLNLGSLLVLALGGLAAGAACVFAATRRPRVNRG